MYIIYEIDFIIIYLGTVFPFQESRESANEALAADEGETFIMRQPGLGKAENLEEGATLY